MGATEFKAVGSVFDLSETDNRIATESLSDSYAKTMKGYATVQFVFRTLVDGWLG